jgi:hypothetical protein
MAVLHSLLTGVLLVICQLSRANGRKEADEQNGRGRRNDRTSSSFVFTNPPQNFLLIRFRKRRNRSVGQIEFDIVGQFQCGLIPERWLQGHGFQANRFQFF